MSGNSGDDVTITVWWTPDCGAMHLEENPVSVSAVVCPDGLTGFSTEVPDARRL